MKNIFFLIDVNSAYLSWEAAYHLQHGGKVDYRKIPSIVGGDPTKRKGIVLAKSIPAKRYNIKTGESISEALRKCPNLKIVSPSYTKYMKASNALVKILKEYSPKVQRFSIDECFLEYIVNKHSNVNPIEVAYEIKERIKNELGFTVNIGVSTNKLLAKMASDLKKPDMVHTLFKSEIKNKMWPLEVDKLFMVGKATYSRLKDLDIHTIGDLAKMDVEILKHFFKSHGQLIWEYANGIENSKIDINNHRKVKSIGNSTTIPYDLTKEKEAFLYILSLTEMVAMRLREKNLLCSLVSISIKNSEFLRYSHQKKLSYNTDLTNDIYNELKKLFLSVWKKEPIRHLGVRVGSLSENRFDQLSIWNNNNQENLKKLDSTIDKLRLRYGENIIKRSSFLHSNIDSINGGVQKDYPMMTSLL
ncbi:MAG: Y-family DNA polymerase [Bacillota bacterium]